ncbi:unnamed protein product [Rotaria sp. Silwood2]|nr:unnamed protein product [Rotaria sp. Silwood2]
MASSKDSEQSITSPERLGAVLANVLQEQLLDGTESMSQTAASTAREVVSDWDNLILSNIIGESTVTSVDDPRVPSDPSLAATVNYMLLDYLVKQKGLSEAQANRLCPNPNKLELANIHDLPKMNKDGTPLRPIVASISMQQQH